MNSLFSQPRLTQVGASCLLTVLIYAGSIISASGQSKPPILSDSDISAFNKGAIQSLATKAADTADPDGAKLARNKLIAITVEQVDNAFNDFRKRSRKRKDQLSFLFDFLEIGASSAISIVGGTRPKALIGEALSLFQGSRSAFNKDFRFLEQQIIFDKMVAKRSDKLSAIYGKLNQTTTKYPWEQARSELRDYFFAGTIDEALSALSRETGAQAKTAEDGLINAKRAAGIVGAPTKAEVEASQENFNLVRKISGVGIPAESSLKVERAKTPPVQGTIDSLDKKVKDVLADWRSLFDVIQADEKLKPLLEQIPRSFSDGDAQTQQNLADQLMRVKENKNPTLLDYDSIALKLSGLASDAVSTDPAPAARLKTILSTSKTIKNNP